MASCFDKYLRYFQILTRAFRGKTGRGGTCRFAEAAVSRADVKRWPRKILSIHMLGVLNL